MEPSHQRISLVKWSEPNELSEAIGSVLTDLGYQVHFFLYDRPIPSGMDYIFTFGPYAEYLQIPYQISRLDAGKRPFLIHWSTQGLPEIRLPRKVMLGISILRSWIGRITPG